LCLAVDPDLLVTVNAMTAGYVVADAPNGLGTASHPGAGQATAQRGCGAQKRLRVRVQRPLENTIFIPLLHGVA
jgi:hypothetical protein